MGSVNKSDIPEISRFMETFWKEIKKNWNPEEVDNEQYWNELSDDVLKISSDFKDDDFVQGAMMFLNDFLEWKRLKQDGKTNHSFIRWMDKRKEMN